MNRKVLWNLCQEKALKRVRTFGGFGREFLLIAQNDFQEMRSHFVVESGNIFHPHGSSMRSKHLWRHVHVIKHGNFVQAHQDVGNPALFLPLVTIHFFCDVLPYVPHLIWYVVVRRIKVDEILFPPTAPRVTNPGMIY